MSIIGSNIKKLHFFHRSGPMPCPYLDGRVERKLFTRLPANADQSQRLNADLSKAGFRRSHDILYKPVCPGCKACIPVRIPIEQFAPNRSMRRNLARNSDLIAEMRAPRAGAEDFALFHRYQRARHGESDMARMSEADYVSMIEEGAASARLMTFREPPISRRPNQLAAVLLLDALDDGFSAVYSFYEPSGYRQGLGIYAILALVERARIQGLPYVYLGYWINGSEKMAYKARFKPLEALGQNGWQTLSASGSASP